MISIFQNEDGKALGAILGIVGVIILIVAVVVVLTVTGSYKYPPSAVNWPVVGSFIAQHGAILEIVEDGEGEDGSLPGSPSAESIMDLQDNGTAKIVRDLTFKKQRIDELEGEMETKNDQISKLNEEIQLMKTQIEHYKPENRKALIKIYDRMEATAAVEILSQIPEERAVIILSSLKDSKAAEILASMDSIAAVKITELMAGFEPTRITDMSELTGNKRPIQPSGTASQPGLNPPPKRDFTTPAPNPQDTLQTDTSGDIVGPPSNSESGTITETPEKEEEEEKTDEEEKKPESPTPSGDESTG